MNPESKSRTVSCRLTAEEYERFRDLGITTGTRSVSDLTRLAINALLQQPAGEFDNSLESRVSELEGRVQLLSLDIRRVCGDGDPS